MELSKNTGSISLLERKHHAAEELLETMKARDLMADYDDDAALIAQIEKRQMMLEQLSQIEKELADARRVCPVKLRCEESELNLKTDELLRQIKLIIMCDIKEVKYKMDFCLSAINKLRKEKNGLMAYMKNGMPSQKQRYDLRG